MSSEDGSIAVMPAGLGCDEAAAISEGFLTAMPFLRDEAKVLPGQRVLINGASGSVGQMAVQLAKYFGAEVTGVCSTTNLKLVRSLAADAVIDYTRDDFTSRTGAWDVIFDAVGKSSFARCREALTPRGVYMTTVPSFAILPQMAWTKIFSGGKRALLATTGLRSSSAKARDLVLLSELVDAGKLRVVIDRRYPMEQIADAHAYVETGRKKGSVVVVIAEEGRKLVAG